MQAEKTKFIYKESPGERTYTSSFYYVLGKKEENRKRLRLFSFILGKTYGSVVIFILNYVMKPFQSCFITNSVSWHLVNIQWFLPSTQNLPLNWEKCKYTAVNTFPLHTFPLQLENAGLFRQRVCNRNITNFTMSERTLNFIGEYFVRMPFFANFFFWRENTKAWILNDVVKEMDTAKLIRVRE